MEFCGQIISEGIAYGKVGFLNFDSNIDLSNIKESNEENLLETAIKNVSQDLDRLIEESKTKLNDRVSEIFETHKFIVNDPVVLDRAYELIRQNFSAKQAYKKAVKEILDRFNQIDNEFMLGRIVDILDATDRVKVALKDIRKTLISDFNKETILFLEELKPSIIYSITNPLIKGFVSKTGFVHQHSGIIARTMKIPGIICKDIFERITSKDYVLIDCIKGEILINPTQEQIKERVEV